jgi:hypothetical protein
MHVSLKGFRLDPSGAERLKTYLSGNQSSPCADGMMAHVLSLGAAYAVLEEPYIDKDYSADYLNFYAAAFRDYPRHTRRLHLFEMDISGHLDLPIAEQQAALAQETYLGFVVLRPIAQGPVGRSVLRFPRFGPGLIVRPAARADYKVHLLGSTLDIEGAAPFIQQDERVGSCAQASIWMAARPVHERHRRTSWHSIAEINRLATTPTDAELSRSLPAGSGGLNPIHIIRALRAMGHQPLFDYFLNGAPGEALCPQDAPSGGETAADAVEPIDDLAASSIVRYLDSGLPVVIALADVGEDIGHAITAVGYVETDGGPVRPGATYDRFVRALIVHDDQRGPYRLMPLTAEDAAGLPQDRLMTYAGEILTVDRAATHMFVPLPLRVFLRADRADTVARDYLKRYVEIAGAGMLTRIAETYPTAVATIERFYDLVRTGGMVQRTYLTSAGRYRHHLAKSDLADEVKAELLLRSLPHFVWVTEMIDPEGSTASDDAARRIIGHMVMNATSSTDPSSDLLLIHMPHVLVHRDINQPVDAPLPFKERAYPVEVHAPYAGRRRH